MSRSSGFVGALGVAALLVSVLACSGANMSGVPDGAGAEADGRECKMGSDGAQVCGYHCRLGSNGQIYCADTPDGSCALQADGTFACTQRAQAEPDAPAYDPTEETTGPYEQPTPADTAPQGEAARCCVNNAYWSCPDLASANRCVGEPMQLMSCVQSCGFDSNNCEERCIEAHGPRPGTSGCSREVARDGECPR